MYEIMPHEGSDATYTYRFETVFSVLRNNNKDFFALIKLVKDLESRGPVEDDTCKQRLEEATRSGTRIVDLHIFKVPPTRYEIGALLTEQKIYTVALWQRNQVTEPEIITQLTLDANVIFGLVNPVSIPCPDT